MAQDLSSILISQIIGPRVKHVRDGVVDSLDEEVGSQKQASIEEPPNAEVELKVRVRG